MCVYILVCAKSLQLCRTLCDPMDCSLPGSSVHGIFQAGILKWVAIFSSRGSSWPRDWTPVSPVSPTLAGRVFTIVPPGKPSVIYIPSQWLEREREWQWSWDHEETSLRTEPTWKDQGAGQGDAERRKEPELSLTLLCHRLTQELFPTFETSPIWDH